MTKDDITRYMTKDDITRLCVLIMGAALIVIAIYVSMVRIELSSTRFNELRNYIKTRDEQWLPFIERTDQHLKQQDKLLKQLIEGIKK